MEGQQGLTIETEPVGTRKATRLGPFTMAPRPGARIAHRFRRHRTGCPCANRERFIYEASVQARDIADKCLGYKLSFYYLYFSPKY